MAILNPRNDFFISVASEDIPGMLPLVLDGLNPDTDTGTVPEDIWDGGGVYPGFTATAAQTLDVVSSSVSDTSAGAGVRTVRITGLLSDYTEDTEDVVMNGTTIVTTSKAFIRVNRTRALTGGATSDLTSNVGTITVTQTTSGILMDQMNPQAGVTQKTCYTVPLGKTVFLIGTFGSLLDNTNDVAAEVAVWTRTFGGVPSVRFRSLFTSGAGSTTIPTPARLPIPAKADFCARILDVESNDASISFTFQSAIKDTP